MCVCIQLESVNPSEVAAVVGGLQDVESMVAMKDLVNAIGSEHVYTEEQFPMTGAGTDARSAYLLNSTIQGIEVCGQGRGCGYYIILLLIGCRPDTVSWH